MQMTYERGQSAGYLTNWAARLFVRAIERRLAGGNAGPMPVFFALLTEGSLSQKELANWASVEQPTMANTLNRMERDGLIVRTPDPDDGRSALISLTRIGRSRAEQAMAAAAEVNGLALSGLKPAERELYFQLISKIIGKLETDEA
jgi:MarR family transcriptional regulator, transcriptional regulator for hemolysin